MKCRGCGFENEEGARFCGNCGTQIDQKTEPDVDEKKFCPNCGKPNRADAKFCENCGSAILLSGKSQVAGYTTLQGNPSKAGPFAWLWSLLGVGLVFLAAGLVYTYWLPKPQPELSQVSLPVTPSPQVTSIACTPQKAFYYEDFTEIQVQDWSNAQQFASMIEIAPAPDDPNNLVLKVKMPEDAAGQVQAFTQLNIPPFSNAYMSLRFYVDGVLPSDNSSWFSFNWLFSPYPVQVDGTEVFDSRYQLPIGYNYFEMRRLQQPLSNESVDRSPSHPLPGRWYELEIATYDAFTQVWLDGRLVMDYQDPQPLPVGTLGLEVWLEDPSLRLMFDDIEICELTESLNSGAP